MMLGDVEITEDLSLSVPVTWYRAQHLEENAPVLLYVYGGTFAMNPGPSHAKIAQVLAEEIKGSVLLPEYSLAPEKPFPLAIEDIVSVYCSLLSSGVAANRIVMMGDTAGAAIALAALLSLRAQGNALPVATVMLFPWVDLTMSGGSYVDHIRHDGRVSDVELLSTFLGDYLQGVDPRDPLASPALADLRGMPPFHVHANVNDVLVDDARLLVDCAHQAQVTAHLHFWDDVPATLQRDAPFTTQMSTVLANIGRFASSQIGRDAQPAKEDRDALQDEYLEIMKNNIQPHMEKRIDEMFAWSKDHGPDWVWTFIEKRIEHGALATQEHIEREWLGSLFSESLQPTLLLTASRYVVHANRAALDYLENGPYLRRKGGRLVGTSSAVDEALSDILEQPFLPAHDREKQNIASLGRIEVADQRVLFLRCHRLDAYGVNAVAPPVAVLRLMEESDPGVRIDEECLVLWYRLSPREAMLASAFANGTSLADYAAQEDVAMSTVRTQFAQIKSKLNARDQASVVRKVLSVAALNS